MEVTKLFKLLEWSHQNVMDDETHDNQNVGESTCFTQGGEHARHGPLVHINLIVELEVEWDDLVGYHLRETIFSSLVHIQEVFGPGCGHVVKAPARVLHAHLVDSEENGIYVEELSVWSVICQVRLVDGE